MFRAYSLGTAFIVNAERRKHLLRMFLVPGGQNCSPRNICLQIEVPTFRWDEFRVGVFMAFDQHNAFTSSWNRM